MDDLFKKKSVQRAIAFASDAHASQVRKYTGEPYVNHPIAVAQIVATVEHTEEMIIAAILHDVVEDTDATLDDIKKTFGQKVATLVAWLTDVSTPHHGNREIRKRLDRKHLAMAPPEVQTIKMADMIDNTISIKTHDPGFWNGTYKKEKLLLLEELTDGDQQLRDIAYKQVLERIDAG